MIIELVFFAILSSSFSLQAAHTTSNTSAKTLMKCISINCPCGNGLFKDHAHAYQVHYELLFRKKNWKNKYERSQCPLCLRAIAGEQKHLKGRLTHYVHKVITSQNFCAKDWYISFDPSEESEPIDYSPPVETALKQQESSADPETFSLLPLPPLFPDLDTQNPSADSFTDIHALLD